MPLDDLEAKIAQHLTRGAESPLLQPSLGTGPDANRLYVIKYTAPKFLSDILTTKSFYASKTPGFTWGDAVYVAPLSYPRSTMMYGAAGIIGWIDSGQMTLYDAVNPLGIAYYQDWIRYFPALYDQLTTTVHADHANRELRNKFRTRFGIDCVLFRPDETCVGYADDLVDFWLAVTAWGATRQVSNGRSQVVKDLKWCAITTEAFEPDGLGYRALIHPALSNGRAFEKCSYDLLAPELKKAYLAATETVVITEF